MAQERKRWILEEHLGSILLLALFFAVTLQIGGRIFKVAPVWTEEVTRYLFIWTVCLGISAGVERQTHVGTEILTSRLSAGGKRIFMALSNLLFIFFGLFITAKSIDLLRMQAAMGHRSPALGLSLWAVTLALPTGFFLAVIRLILQTWRLLIHAPRDKSLR